ncbi:MAG TPA: YbdK family carboxylate-amine ligase [Longimicrobiales bacterium]
MNGAEFTIGVEEEYQVVDPDSGALRGRAPELLAEDGPIREEYQRTMLEVSTPICTLAEEVRRRVAERRSFVQRLAAGKGLAVAAAGLHPVGPYPEEQLSEVESFHRTAARGGAPWRMMHIFGMHVHVAVPDREAAVRAMAGATPFLPHLLVLSASSPFHLGRDTDFQSYRTVLRDMSPRVGPPLPVISIAEYDTLVRLLAGGPVRPGENSPLAWDVRPSERYPTLEFRLFDVGPWLDTVALLAAMARALTAMFADKPVGQQTGTEMQLIRENRWRAARFGLDANFLRLDPPTGEQRDARASIRALGERLAPIAERLGDGDVLADLDRILARGTAATAMREVHQRTSSFPAVVRWVVEQTQVGAAGG